MKSRCKWVEKFKTKTKSIYPKSNQSSQVILYYVAVYSVEHFGQ